MKADAQRDATAHSCCGEHDHDRGMNVAAAESPQPGKKYFCAMCEGVESDTPGSCARCGMALQRNPAFLEPKQNYLHLPDASADSAGSPGKLPDMRHDSGAEDDRSGG